MANMAYSVIIQVSYLALQISFRNLEIVNLGTLNINYKSVIDTPEHKILM